MCLAAVRLAQRDTARIPVPAASAANTMRKCGERSDETEFANPWAMNTFTGKWMRPSQVQAARNEDPDKKSHTFEIAGEPITFVQESIGKRAPFFRKQSGAMKMKDRAGNSMTREHLAAQHALLNLKGQTITLHHSNLHFEQAKLDSHCPGHQFLVLDTDMEQFVNPDGQQYYIDNTLTVVDIALIPDGPNFQQYELEGIRKRFEQAGGVLGCSAIKHIAVEVFVTHATGAAKFQLLHKKFDFVSEIKVIREKNKNGGLPRKFTVQKDENCSQSVDIININGDDHAIKFSGTLHLCTMPRHCQAQYKDFVRKLEQELCRKVKISHFRNVALSEKKRECTSLRNHNQNLQQQCDIALSEKERECTRLRNRNQNLQQLCDQREQQIQEHNDQMLKRRADDASKAEESSRKQRKLMTDQHAEIEGLKEQVKSLDSELNNQKVLTETLNDELGQAKRITAGYVAALRLPDIITDVIDDVQEVMYNMVSILELEQRDAANIAMGRPGFRERIARIVPFYGTPWGLRNLSANKLNYEMYLACSNKVYEYACGRISENELKKYIPYKPGSA